ncbi:GNAT family N-acetyltransferase [Rhodanobacter sp. A1T4]|jgi:RimJ/RimL family protein N-acetyltransferase|uniref:GNAT family N-acetyltransferase n=1 Tax=Rhodanobacter sp. A1T4 TaxID=2723087 RepID=UPI001617E4D0|nr:GNAT family N-acetyltransferase [Rhodanobacter sp. A1T4]MBB6245774.1 RimJ/RimL family protein N-acetyltransferase [Rhodanobacter sp. A1T4]
MDLDSLRIETDRLILRPMRAEDFEGWAALMADDEGSRHIGGPQSRAVAWRGFLSMAGAWAIQGYAMFSVIEKSTGHWIGRLGPWQPEGWPGTEVGWGLVREAWGKGYAPEGAVAAMDWAFDVLGWDEIIHCIAPDNLASQAVAHKLGSQLLRPGRMPEPFQDHPIEIWGQTREQWRKRRVRG